MNDERSFATLPIHTLFRNCVIPGMATMLFSSLYMVADGIFVGQCLGSKALSAINLVFPFLAITWAVSDMIAIGSSVRIATALGKQDFPQARRLFSASMLAIFSLSVIFQVASLIFAKPTIHAFIDDFELANLTTRYLTVYCYTLPITTQLFSLDNYLRVCGKITYCMKVNVAVSILNVILDALLLGILRFGIEAAALTSTLSMCLGTALSLLPFLRRTVTLQFVKPAMYLHEWLNVFYNGSSELLNKIALSVVSIAMNCSLLCYGGANAVAAYAAVLYLDSVLRSIIWGILDAMQPPVSYNYGAQNYQRTMGLFKISVQTILILTALFIATAMLFSQKLVGCFISPADDIAFTLAQKALWLTLPAMAFAWFNMLVGSFLTNFNRPGESLIIMALRAMILPLALLFILPKLWKLNGLFLVQSFSCGITFIVTVFLWKRFRQQVSQLSALKNKQKTPNPAPPKGQSLR